MKDCLHEQRQMKELVKLDQVSLHLTAIGAKEKYIFPVVHISLLVAGIVVISLVVGNLE